MAFEVLPIINCWDTNRLYVHSSRCKPLIGFSASHSCNTYYSPSSDIYGYKASVHTSHRWPLRFCQLLVGLPRMKSQGWTHSVVFCKSKRWRILIITCYCTKVFLFQISYYWFCDRSIVGFILKCVVGVVNKFKLEPN